MDTSFNLRRHRDKTFWPTTTEDLDLTDLAGLIARSDRIDGAQVDYLQTFWVLDTSHVVGEVNAVILDSHRGLVSTVETVSKLMQRVAADLQFGAQYQLQELVCSLGLPRFKLPLICRDMQFLPVTFRHLAGRHWFGVHQYCSAKSVAGGAVVQLYNGLRLFLPVSKRALVNQIDRVQVLHRYLANDTAYYNRFNYGGAVGGQQLAPELTYAGYRKFSQHLSQQYYGLPLDGNDLDLALMGYFGLKRA
ncbi:hypothetical protein [Lactiplantibacillus daowaiensis]|uniref:Uncharacterized protein n=1 Tax=Lactiplantibacillus daowaiensis TaxID=2559918 RepID=A0ABW1RWG5_9LACO|nr:hypothetical protein [Lactiplantibacillus daowaiensis]